MEFGQGGPCVTIRNGGRAERRGGGERESDRKRRKKAKIPFLALYVSRIGKVGDLDRGGLKGKGGNGFII